MTHILPKSVAIIEKQENNKIFRIIISGDFDNIHNNPIIHITYRKENGLYLDFKIYYTPPLTLEWLDEEMCKVLS